jgi:hypothetical protein
MTWRKLVTIVGSVLEGEFDYGAKQVAIEGKSVLVHSYGPNSHSPAFKDRCFFTMEVEAGGDQLVTGDVVVLYFDAEPD